jgi:hypothetical protein
MRLLNNTLNLALFLLTGVSATTLSAQHVGVNTATPLEDLHVRGNARIDHKFLLYTGDTLVPAATLTVPDTSSMVVIGRSIGSTQANALSGPATPKEGQLLYILNRDDDAGTFAGQPVPGNGKISGFAYLQGSWHPISAGGGTATVLGGTVVSSGAVVRGPISVSKTATGRYTVTFDTPLTTTPNVILSGYMSSGSSPCSNPPCTDAPTLSLDPTLTSYCIPFNTTVAGESYQHFCSNSGVTKYIADVFTTGGITNISHTGTTCNGFAPNAGYTFGAGTVTVNPLGSFNLNVTCGANSGSNLHYLYVWVDWNQDGDFEDIGEAVYDSGAELAGFTTTITAPCAAPCGTTRMRVRSARNSALTGGACSSPNWFGETGDYNLTILDPTVTAPGFCNLTSVSTTGFSCNCYDPAGMPLDLGFTFLASE